MRWKRGQKSKYVEDRRGSTPSRMPGGLGKAGIGGGVLAIILVLVFGKDAIPFLSGSDGGSSAPAPGQSSGASPTSSGTEAQGIPPEQDKDAELKDFITFVIDDVQDTWVKIFPQAYGERYEHATLVLFSDRVRSACGLTSAAVGPFYCPGDKKAYIDFSFYRDLKSRFRAPGDFAQAYVIAHEIGHHVQNLTGTSEEVHRAQQRLRGDKARANELSVRLELQADCLAGVWAHYSDRRNVLETGDIDEGLAAAAAIGDDRLQKQATGTTNPESWTHGSSAQRVRWFKAGFRSGQVRDCDTFAAGRL